MNDFKKWLKKSQNIKNVWSLRLKQKVGYIEDVEKEIRKKIARITINTKVQTKTDNFNNYTTFLYTTFL